MVPKGWNIFLESLSHFGAMAWVKVAGSGQDLGGVNKSVPPQQIFAEHGLIKTV